MSEFVVYKDLVCKMHGDFRFPVHTPCPICNCEDRQSLVDANWQLSDDLAMAQERVKELEAENWCRTALRYQETIKELEGWKQSALRHLTEEDEAMIQEAIEAEEKG